ncbi:hypothetical protein CMO90_01320 [Candidatus Woesearchaeota archaeon]|nr:hypothetical protein [Candidatus Woesearchaeota archaeon]
MNYKLFFSIFVFFIFVNLISAQSNVSVGLQQIIDYNKQSTIDFSVKISFFIAFVAGLIGILSPCILPFLPAYFSYTFKEKKNITFMTLVFFFGFSSAFITMGIIAGFIGERSIQIIKSEWLIFVAGIFLFIMGVLSFSGKGFSSFIKHDKKFKNDIPGTFLFGVFFAIGWTACLGPILAGILGIGALLNNVFYSALLLFFYSLGNLMPLFILAVFYDKFNLSKSKFIKGKMFEFSVDEKKYFIHSTNLIAGILFIIMGLFLLIFKGTGFINVFDIFKTKKYFYSLQDLLIVWPYSNILGMILFIVFVVLLARFLWKNKNN